MDVPAEIKKKLSGLQNFESSIVGIIQNSLQQNEVEILKYNTEKQLYEQGITSMNVRISDYAPYTAYTVAIKTAKGQPTNRVTLRDEEDFHKSFSLRFNSDMFEIIANDWKTEELVIKYGEEIMGLTKENLEKVVKDFVFPKLQEELKNYI